MTIHTLDHEMGVLDFKTESPVSKKKARVHKKQYEVY